MTWTTVDGTWTFALVVAAFLALVILALATAGCTPLQPTSVGVVCAQAPCVPLDCSSYR